MPAMPICIAEFSILDGLSMELASLQVVFGTLLKNEDSQMLFFQVSCNFIHLFLNGLSQFESASSILQLSQGPGEYPVRCQFLGDEK